MSATLTTVPMVWLIPESFANPTRLLMLLIIPLVVAGYIFATLRRNRRGMRFTNTSMLEVVVKKQSAWRRHLAVGLSLLSLVTLTAAWATPEDQTLVERERATVVLVIDVSLSMQATDVEPNRLAAAQSEAKQFVESIKPGFNVALVAMSGGPAIVMRPTTDHQAVIRAIDGLQLQESTAIGESIALALRALDQAPKDPAHPDDPAPGAIVLLSDGENTTGRAPDQVASEAKKDEIPIYTIAYGTENGYVDLDGKREPVPVDREQMQRIADQTGGKMFTAKNPEQLKEAYQGIKQETGYVPAKREVTSRFAGYGLAFAVLAALAAISLAAKWP